MPVVVQALAGCRQLPMPLTAAGSSSGLNCVRAEIAAKLLVDVELLLNHWSAVPSRGNR
jgi:hypothetical protein